jgi:hypothetical protein
MASTAPNRLFLHVDCKKLEDTMLGVVRTKWRKNEPTGSEEIFAFISRCKGKAISAQAWTGLEGSRRLRLRNYQTIVTLRW